MQTQKLLNTQSVEDAPRNERRCRIKVQIEPLSLVLPSGHYVRKNDPTSAEVIIYQSDLQRVKDLIEPAYTTEPQLWEAAEASYRAALHRLFAAKLGGNWDDPLNLEDSVEARKRLEDTFGESVQSHFQFLNNRSLKPLRSVKVLDDDLPPPSGANPVAESDAQMSKIVATVIKELATAGVFSQASKKGK